MKKITDTQTMMANSFIKAFMEKYSFYHKPVAATFLAILEQHGLSRDQIDKVMGLACLYYTTMSPQERADLLKNPTTCFILKAIEQQVNSEREAMGIGEKKTIIQ